MAAYPLTPRLSVVRPWSQCRPRRHYRRRAQHMGTFWCFFDVGNRIFKVEWAEMWRLFSPHHIQNMCLTCWLQSMALVKNAPLQNKAFLNCHVNAESAPRLNNPSVLAHHLGWSDATDHLHLSCYYSKQRFVLFMLLEFKSIVLFFFRLLFLTCIVISRVCFIKDFCTCILTFNRFKHQSHWGFSMKSFFRQPPCIHTYQVLMLRRLKCKFKNLNVI